MFQLTPEEYESLRSQIATLKRGRGHHRIREILATHKELARKLAELEAKMAKHDVSIKSLFEAIHQLMALPQEKRRSIGFQTSKKAKSS